MSDIPKEVLEILPPAKWEAIRFRDVLVLVNPDHPVMVACQVEGRWVVTAIDPSKPVTPVYGWYPHQAGTFAPATDRRPR